MIGEIVRGVISSADASAAGAAATLYRTDGVAFGALAAGQRLVITDAEWVCAAGAGLVKLFSDNDADGVVDAGEELLYMAGSNITSCVERYAKQGKTVKARAAAAGQIDIIFSAYVLNT
jgi:hypothetical protein